MKEYRYTIILQPDREEGGYSVTIPALEGCVTQGETLEEAIGMAKDAVQLYLETLQAEGTPFQKSRSIPRQ